MLKIDYGDNFLYTKQKVFVTIQYILVKVENFE